MHSPGEFIIEDVRCFEGEQRARMRPITLLVGENSTGKTTFLGCYRVLRDILSNSWILGGQVNFNQAPFLMGAFRDIVRSKRTSADRIHEFKLGFGMFADSEALRSASLSLTFSEYGSQPDISSVRWAASADTFFEVSRSGDDSLLFKIPGRATRSKDVRKRAWHPLAAVEGIEYTMTMIERGLDAGDDKDMNDVIEYIREVFKDRTRNQGYGRPDRILPSLPKLSAVAPLRSRPKRTYDPVGESASPEGEHVPMLMMRLERTDNKSWGVLHDDLVAFGKEAGLFKDLKVKRHGKQMSDPFQLQVKVHSGTHANIMDVGYGVSQSLPILIDVMGASDRVFLLQQPEVHLHPRGQAELANLFVHSFTKRGNGFVIETHSDYIVDRIRVCVRKGLLNAADVSVLYFEPKGNRVQIRNIELDTAGNVVGAPQGYRDFFVRETNRVLGFEN